MDNKDKNIFSLSLDIDFSSEQKISDLISKYNNTYEPLTLSGNELNEMPWSWEDSPWPWEGV